MGSGRPSCFLVISPVPRPQRPNVPAISYPLSQIIKKSLLKLFLGQPKATKVSVLNSGGSIRILLYDYGEYEVGAKTDFDNVATSQKQQSVCDRGRAGRPRDH